MNFLAPLAFLGALMGIPILLLYMLRLRRREVMVSSNFLWQQVLQDNEANTPWQRLRRNLLLFLQLLILAFIVFALARPYITVPAVSTGRTALLLDASASMTANDIDDGTRFEAARREAIGIIDTLSEDTEMTIISVSDAPQVLTAYTSDKGQLRDAIQDATPGLAQADWNAALNLAVAGRVEGEDFTVVIVGDGGLGRTDGLPGVEGELRYVPVGLSADNVAITALATRALPGQPPQLFGQITNYGTVDTEVIFSLRVDGELLTSERYTVPAGSNLPVVSTAALGEDFQTLEANLTLSVNSEGSDYVTVDNNAFAVAAQQTERRVLLMTPGNLFVEQILRSLPGMQTFRGNTNIGVGEQPYDIYVFENWLPDALPAGDLLFINPPGSTSLFTLGGENADTDNPVVNTSPLTAFVDFSEVALLRFRNVFGADWADPLIEVDGGPILLAGETGGRQVALLPFDLRESNLPLNIAWVALMANLIDWFTPLDALTASSSVSVGDTVAITPPAGADAIRIILPDGETVDLPVDRERIIFAGTGAPGLYTLSALEGETVLQQQPVAVNLFSPLESAIAPIAEGSLQVGDTVIPAAETETQGQRELWPVLVALTLLFLMIEWYAYHQRVRVPSRPGDRPRGLLRTLIPIPETARRT